MPSISPHSLDLAAGPFTAAGGTTSAANTAMSTTGSGDSTGLNWLLTWLGEAPLAGEEVQTETPGQSLRRQGAVHWLPVHPPEMSGIETLLAVSSDGKKDGDTPSLPSMAAADTGPSVAELPITGASTKEEEEPSEDEHSYGDIPAPLALGTPPPTTAGPPPVSSDKQVELKSPIDHSPGAISAETPAQPPAPVADDKGELVWASDLVVSHPSEGGQSQAEGAQITPDHSEPVRESILSKPDDTLGSQQDSSGQSGAEAREGDSGSPKQEPKQTAELPTPSGRSLIPSKKESEPPPAERSLPQTAVAATITEAPALAHPHTAAAPTIDDAAANVAPLPPEPAQPLRTGQIATLQVDVPSAAGIEGAAPMRLIVSQRGDQVSVRLRSWDNGTAPLSNDQMQPLLDSLSSQGLVGERRPIERLGEPVHVLPEGHAEKTPVLTESAGTNGEQQSFQNANDRQQQNQERQQQQAYFLRRQGKNTPAEEFTLPPWVEGSTVRY